MAIYHFHAKIIKRSYNESSLAAAAYHSASRLEDKRRNEVFDYRRKKDVIYSKIMAPKNAPAWVYEREKLWNEVENTEKRRDAQLARAIVLALPRNLKLPQQKLLLQEFIDRAFIIKGMIVDFSIHSDKRENPHVHILLTTRKLINGAFTTKVREWNTPDILVEWRKAWAEIVNDYFQKLGIDDHIDHRSYLDQGIQRQPTCHLGSINYFAHKERKVDYDRYLNNLRIQSSNRHRVVNMPISYNGPRFFCRNFNLLEENENYETSKMFSNAPIAQG